MKRSNWFEGLLEAEKLTLEGYTASFTNGWIQFEQDGWATLRVGRYDSNFNGMFIKDEYFQGMLDYLTTYKSSRSL